MTQRLTLTLNARARGSRRRESPVLFLYAAARARRPRQRRESRVAAIVVAPPRRTHIFTTYPHSGSDSVPYTGGGTDVNTPSIHPRLPRAANGMLKPDGSVGSSWPA